MPFTTNPGSFFRQSDPMASGMGAMMNSQNYKDPMFAMNPMRSGSMANAGLNMMMPGMGMVMGKGGGGGPSYYATGPDQQTTAARSYLTKTLGDWANAGNKTYKDNIAQGKQNLEQAKLLENSRLIGPHLAATNVKAVPGFLGGGGLYSGADRGTDYGKALEGAIAQGKTETPEIKNELGAKGTPRGIGNYIVPKQPAGIKASDIMTPMSALLQDAQNRAGQMTQQGQSQGGK